MKWKLFLTLLSFALVSCSQTQRPVWQWTLESRCYAEPVIDGIRVYVVSQAGNVISGNFQTGTKFWTAKLKGPILASPDFSETSLFTATENGYVYRLNKETGKEVWKIQFSDQFAAPVTAEKDMILVPSSNGTLYALSPESGELLWKHSNNRRYTSRAILNGTHILIGGWANEFYCFRKDGSIEWRFRAAHEIVDDAIAYKNIVLFATHDDFVYALDIPSGRLLWRFAAKSPTNLLLMNNQLVFGDLNVHLFVIHPESGKVLRKFLVGKQMARIYSFSDRCLIVSKKIYELDMSNGKTKLLIWHSRPIFKMAFAPGMFIVSDELYSILAYRS